jgi:hypothetical protein
VKEMGLRVTSCKAEVKVVNSKEKVIARGHLLSSHSTRQVERSSRFHSVSYGNFEIILGKEFLRGHVYFSFHSWISWLYWVRKKLGFCAQPQGSQVEKCSSCLALDEEGSKAT